ncbi:MAG: hypothetical protein E5X51_23420 [Mesorhizobium sp.]|uniref:hypothetical protein n=1 Tax=Mesorhizobium sp. TaxID=1871066 RepID=UPI0012140118|nr:hypothetical protein [Mesorhizobium sp.]TIQ18875.1 MAG: hypothetical protein E5X51_23420 [Mesorhizobium sp.]
MILKRTWGAFWRKVDMSAATVFILAAFAGVGLASVVTSALDNHPTVIFEEAKVITPEVPQGGVLDLQYTIVLNRICPASVERFVTDSEGAVHVPSTYTVDRRSLIEGYPPEGRETYQRSVTIPLAAATGKAHYDARFSYFCNLWHKLTKPIVVNAPPAYFTITPAPAPLDPLVPEQSP